MTSIIYHVCKPRARNGISFGLWHGRDVPGVLYPKFHICITESLDRNRVTTKWVREIKYRALMYDISWFQKRNFYLILITSKFYLKSFLPPSSFSVKSGCNRIGLKTTFLEPENIIYHCLVLGFPDSFHGLPTDFSKTPWYVRRPKRRNRTDDDTSSHPSEVNFSKRIA